MEAMCDTLVIVRPDRVLFAKNSDRDPNEAQLLEWVPARMHAPGSTLRCTWLEIPQARETYSVLLSRPYWMWGAEIGANEHGLVIGNEAVFTRQPYRRVGLTGMDLLRLALERAATAKEACDLIQSLIREHGQGGGCGHEHRSFTYHNSFLIADPRGAIVLETAGGESAVEFVRGARSISNGLSIAPFAAAHSDRLRTSISQCQWRRARTEDLARSAQGIHDVAAILADHGSGCFVPEYRWLNGAMAAPCMHAGGVVASAQTTASWIAELAPGGARHWVTGTSAPCMSLYKPIDVTQPLDLGPIPTDQFDPRALWWRHERFHRIGIADPHMAMEVFQTERTETQASWFAHPPSSREAFQRANDLLDRWTRELERRYIKDQRPFWVRRYWSARNTRAGLQLPDSLH